MSALVSYGTKILSARKLAGYGAGAGTPAYVETALTDHVLGTYLAYPAQAAWAAVDAGAAITPDFLALWSPVSTGTLRAQGSNNANFSTLITDVAMTPRNPSSWADLRSVSPRTARYWRAIFAATGLATVFFSELVVGTLDTLPLPQWGYTEKPVFLEGAIEGNERGAISRDVYGVKVRVRDGVRFIGGESLRSTMGRIADATRAGSSVVLIPNETGNDPWLLDWTDDDRPTPLADEYYQYVMTIVEQSAGVLI